MRKGTSQKGTKYENFVANNFRLMKYTVHQVKQNRRRIRGRFINIGEDILGADIIAKKKGRRTVWIQVTTGYQLKKKANAFFEFNCWTHIYDRLIVILAIENKEEATLQWKTYEWKDKTDIFTETDNWWDIELMARSHSRFNHR